MAKLSTINIWIIVLTVCFFIVPVIGLSIWGICLILKHHNMFPFVRICSPLMHKHELCCGNYQPDDYNKLKDVTSYPDTNNNNLLKDYLVKLLYHYKEFKTPNFGDTTILKEKGILNGHYYQVQNGSKIDNLLILKSIKDYNQLYDIKDKLGLLKIIDKKTSKGCEMYSPLYLQNVFNDVKKLDLSGNIYIIAEGDSAPIAISVYEKNKSSTKVFLVGEVFTSVEHFDDLTNVYSITKYDSRYATILGKSFTSFVSDKTNSSTKVLSCKADYQNYLFYLDVKIT